MKVKDLIEQLKNVPPNDYVFIWVDGNRYEISCIDIDSGDNMVDLNAKIEHREAV